MLPLFTTPLAFWGLLALPTLAGIYLLRSRARRRPVSSLMLWRDLTEARDGGPRIDRLRLPWIFFLELLILLLLILAAAGPLWHGASAVRPVIVVLDDSFSMQAGTKETPRSRGQKALEELLADRGTGNVRFVLAGARPQILGDPVRTSAEMRAVLEAWTCRAPAAVIEDAIGLASELASEHALLLIVTDHAPETPPGEGRMQWWAFGDPLPNTAFVNAQRTTRDGTDRVLLEVANLARDRQSTTLVLETGDPPAEFQRLPLDLAAKEVHRRVLQLKPGSGVLRARLADDELAFDNAIALLPTPEAALRVEVAIGSEPLRKLVEKTVDATGHAVRVAARPELRFTDAASDEAATGDTWTVQLLAEKQAEAFTGPFVLDRSHPLTEALALQGIVWGAGRDENLPGSPLILAGNVPLLTDRETASGRHELTLRFRPDLSTLHQSPNWPILFSNLFAWRSSQLPGLKQPNIRLGSEVAWTLTADAETATLIRPDDERQAVAMQGRRITVQPDQPGLYRLEAGEQTVRFAINPLAREESDLTRAETVRQGNWLDETTLRLEYRPMSWLLLLAALAALVAHQLLVVRQSGRSRP